MKLHPSGIKLFVTPPIHHLFIYFLILITLYYIPCLNYFKGFLVVSLQNLVAVYRYSISNSDSQFSWKIIFYLFMF